MTSLPAAPSRSFASDNAAGAHPAVLDAVIAANVGHALAYGDDDHTRRCEANFSEQMRVQSRPVLEIGASALSTT